MTLVRSECTIALIASLAGLALPDAGSLAAAQPGVTLVFRYDDYGNASPTEIDRRVIRSLHARRMCATFGVIPYQRSKDKAKPGEIPLSQEKADILRRAIREGTAEAAMHGFLHTSVAKHTRGKGNEWAGVAYALQEARIARAKKHLDTVLDTNVTTFLPPWNRYDANTTKALAKAGFACMAASRRAEAIESSSLVFLPATADLTEVRDAVAQARRLPPRRHVIVVQLHPFDFTPGNETLGPGGFEALLAWIASQQDIRVWTLARVAREMSGFGSAALTKNKWYTAAAYLTPPAIKHRFSAEHVYLSDEIALGMNVKAWALLLGLYGLIAALSSLLLSFAARSVFARWAAVARVCKYAWPVAACLPAAYALAEKNRNHRGALILSVTLGACLGILSAFRKLRKARRSSPPPEDITGDGSAVAAKPTGAKNGPA